MLTNLRVPWSTEFEDELEHGHQLCAAYERSRLDHCTQLNVDSRPRSIKLTGIMVTLGITNSYPTAIVDIIQAGASIVRLNMSHETEKWYAITIRSIRKAGNILYKVNNDITPLGVAIDLIGPEIHTGVFHGDPNSMWPMDGAAIAYEHLRNIFMQDYAVLVENSFVRLSTDNRVRRAGTSTCFWVSFPDLPKVSRIGDTILIDRGIVIMTVTCIGDNSITCRVKKGGTIRNKRSVQLIDTVISLPMVSDQDILHVNFASNVESDFVIVNQARSAKMIRSVHRCLKETGSTWIRVLAKICSKQGLEHFDEIMQEADGIIFERIGLELELGKEKLFIAQKAIIAKCNKAGKPVVVTFHPMLEETPKLNTELIASAVLDGVDTIALSTGNLDLKDTLQLVKEVEITCREAESARWQKEIFDTFSNMTTIPLDMVHSIALGAIQTSLKCNATAIIITTTTGRSAVLLSIYRPRCPIVAVTRFGIVARYLRIYFAVHSVHYKGQPHTNWLRDVEARVQAGINYLRQNNYISVGDAIVIVGPSRQDSGGFTNSIRLVYASPGLINGEKRQSFELDPMRTSNSR